MKALVVDDEAPARDELRYLLASYPELEVTEAATAEQALGQATPLDVVFCDVEMPGLSGLDAARLIQALPGRPALVFVTAHDRYAVDAFAVEAFDYLLKPVDPNRLDRLIERLREARQEAVPPSRLAVVGPGDRTLLLDEAAVVFVRADGDYSRVHTYERSYLCTSSLRELEQALAPGFARVHRSTLVNVARVAGVGRAGPDRLSLTMDDRERTEVEVSRRSSREIRQRLGL